MKQSVAYLIVHVISVTHVITGARASLYVSSHVELNFLTADAPRIGHHRVAHAVSARAVHPRVSLIQVTASRRIVVTQSTRAPRIYGVTHSRLRSLLESQPRLRSMETRRYVLRTNIPIVRQRPVPLQLYNPPLSIRHSNKQTRYICCILAQCRPPRHFCIATSEQLLPATSQLADS